MITKSRCAKTGQFVTAAYAKKHPGTTVTERRKSMPDKTALRELAIAAVQMSLRTMQQSLGKRQP